MRLKVRQVFLMGSFVVSYIYPLSNNKIIKNNKKKISLPLLRKMYFKSCESILFVKDRKQEGKDGRISKFISHYFWLNSHVDRYIQCQYI